MKRLPIGEQDFKKLISRDCVYVDKTAIILQLLKDSGSAFFLSRPRRFGKSLLLSTIKAFFEGKKELFEGLYIYDKVSWENQHPVIHLDMSGLETRSAEKFEESLSYRILFEAEYAEIKINSSLPGDRLFELIDKMYSKTGRRVVVLVDEYDKPIQDVLPKPELAAEIREILRNFYTVIKTKSDKLHFVFLTGVSKIAQVSIFSGLNNLKDLTLDKRYSGICGYTQAELEANFKDYIEQLAIQQSLNWKQVLEKIKEWYNGYSWDGKTFVYNPFSTLLLLDSGEFDPHWFRTGTPTFLLELMEKRRDFSPVLEQSIIVNREFSDSQTLERMDTVPLFFQTGYLTIKKRVGDNYLLEIPNNEVKLSLSNFLLSRLTDKPEYEVKNHVEGIRRGLEQEDLDGAIKYLGLLLAHLTYDSHLPYEAHYHALLQLTLLLMGIPGQSEVHTDKGRTDLIIKLPGLVYITELKYAKNSELLESALDEGMNQIKDKRYYETELHKGRKVWLLALAVSQGEIKYKAEQFT
ncbi:ATP-binding protein [Flavitalea flava]